MKKILFGILIMTLNSCHLIGKGNGIKLTIENKSNFPMENVIFSTSENITKLKFKKIEPNKNVSEFLSMKDNKSDGNYVLKFTLNGKKETQGYGYYTNGSAIDTWVVFEIENDTIKQRFSGMKY